MPASRCLRSIGNAEEDKPDALGLGAAEVSALRAACGTVDRADRNSGKRAFDGRRRATGTKGPPAIFGLWEDVQGLRIDRRGRTARHAAKARDGLDAIAPDAAGVALTSRGTRSATRACILCPRFDAT